jgi:hypothetical protein
VARFCWMGVVRKKYKKVEGCWYQVLSLKFCPQVVIEKQHLQTPISSPTTSKMHFQKAKTIQLGTKLKCPNSAKEACAHAWNA